MIKKIEHALDSFEDFVMILFMAIAITLTFTQVVLRYVFNAPLFWAEEVVLYSIICMSFIGISYGIKHHSHIAVEVLRAFLPDTLERQVYGLQLVIGIVFSITLLVLGTDLVTTTFNRGQLSPALRLPIASIYLVIPVAGACATFRYFIELVRLLRGERQEEAEENLNMM